MSITAPESGPPEIPSYLHFFLSGWGDLNSRPSVPQIDAPQTADLRKRPETASDLPFEVLNSSRWFALFRDVSRPVRGLTAVARSVPIRPVAGFVGDEAGGDPAYPTSPPSATAG